MSRTGLISLNDSRVAIPLLQDIIDGSALKIISSIIDVEKNVFQICYENKLPLSSTYKKIRKLHHDGLVLIEKIDIDDKGRKVVFYKSKIKSLDFNLKKDGILLQFNANDQDDNNRANHPQYKIQGL